MLLVQLPVGFALIFLDVMPGNPQTSDACPEVSREFCQRVKESVIYDLRDDAPREICSYHQQRISNSENSHGFSW